MIQTESQLIRTAQSMLSPLVYANTSRGSGATQFLLIDRMPDKTDAPARELTRSLFNGCREKGTLYQDAQNPLKVGDYQAWRVRMEVQDDG